MCLLDSANQTWQEKIGKIQNRSLRICLKRRIRGNSVLKLHQDCETPLPALRRKEMLISQFFNRSKKLPPTKNPRTRNDFLPCFTLRRPKSEFYKRSPFYRGAMEWNKLPPHIQICDTRSSFKLQLKKFLGTDVKRSRQKRKKKKHCDN